MSSDTKTKVGDLVDALNTAVGIERNTGLWVRVRGCFYQVSEFRVDRDMDLIIEVEDE